MSIHKPVLLREVIRSLDLKKDSVIIDATLGSGGHSQEILKIIKGGKLIAIDADNQAIENFRKKADERTILVNNNFANLKNVLQAVGIEKVDAVLADLGWSLDQLERRGMSFMKDEPLDMRISSRIMNPAKQDECTSDNPNAEYIVNNYPEKELSRIFYEYGEEKYARKIAKRIIAYRKDKAIKTTFELVKIIGSAVPEKYKRRKIHFATRTFQAIRIEVNQELENLKKFVPQAIEALNLRGRLAVISFHSLEDRIVKNIFRENARGCICPKDFPQCVCGKHPVVEIITKKPVVPSEEEVRNNHRSRSAKLRVCEKIHPVE